MKFPGLESSVVPKKVCRICGYKAPLKTYKHVCWKTVSILAVMAVGAVAIMLMINGVLPNIFPNILHSIFST